MTTIIVHAKTPLLAGCAEIEAEINDTTPGDLRAVSVSFISLAQNQRFSVAAFTTLRFASSG